MYDPGCEGVYYLHGAGTHLENDHDKVIDLESFMTGKHRASC